MAAHFPADYNVFAAVCMDSPDAAIQDLGLLREIRQRLDPFTERFGEFIGSPEDPKTFRVILDLEQMIGQKIHWVRGESFEAMCRRKSALPNQDWRFCTTELKMRPIAEFVYKETGGGKVLNCTGLRIDEPQRVKTEGHRAQIVDIVIGKHNSGKQKWLKYEFAEAAYPLIFDDSGAISVRRKAEIYQWAYRSGLDFPERSNCQFCFHKQPAELKENQMRNPGIFTAGARMERNLQERKHAASLPSMKKDLPLQKIIDMRELPEQLAFFFGGESCDSGFCND